MVALGLIAFIYLAIPTSADNITRKRLETAIDSLDRAVRFATNEAILRNTIVRVRILLDKQPVEFAVEYGPSEKFLLPSYEDISKLSLKEQEKYTEVVEGVNRQFNKVSEFKEFNRQFDENVKVLGIGTSLYPNIISENDASIYFYPSGDRDSAIIITSSGNEIATLEIQPYTEKTIDSYFVYDEVDGIEVDDKLYELAKEQYLKWLK